MDIIAESPIKKMESKFLTGLSFYLFHFLLIFLICASLVRGQVSDDLIFDDSNGLATEVELVHNETSEELVFRYTNIQDSYPISCRIGDTTIAMTMNRTLGRTLVANGSVVDRIIDPVISPTGDGTFALILLPNVDDHHDECLRCGFFADPAIFLSECVLLQITKYPNATLMQVPDFPFTGEEFRVICRVSGFPFPDVDFVAPRGLEIENILVSEETALLKTVDYEFTVPYADRTWNQRTVQCGISNSTPTKYNYTVLTLEINVFNSTFAKGHTSGAIIGISVGGLCGMLIIIGIVIAVVFLRKRNEYSESSGVYSITGNADESYDFVDNNAGYRIKNPKYNSDEDMTSSQKSVTYEISTTAYV